MSDSESRNRETFFASSPDAHSNLHWPKAKMILSFILGLAVPSQLYIYNNFPFDGPHVLVSTDYLLIVPLYVIYIGWSSTSGWHPVLAIYFAPFIWSVIGHGTWSVIQFLVGLPVAISVWRAGTGRGDGEIIKPATLLNILVFLVMTIGIDVGILREGAISMFYVPLFPGMAIVGCYYLWKARQL